MSERLAEANSRTAAVLVDELDARLFERDSDSMRSMLSAAELAVYRLQARHRGLRNSRSLR